MIETDAVKNRLTAEERAVSPVIGVILMVAITVILAAVIGTFVLDLGQSTGEKTPQVSFGFEYDSSESGNVTVTHEGGDTIQDANTGNLTVRISGSVSATGEWARPVSAGDNFIVGNNSGSGNLDPQATIQSGDKIRVIWESNSGKTQVIGEFNVP